MAYKIRYLPGAYASIEAILDYLAGFYTGKAAKAFRKELQSAIAKLADQPCMAQADWDHPSYRRLVVGQYLVYYRVDDAAQTVSIHRVLRASWNLKPE